MNRPTITSMAYDERRGCWMTKFSVDGKPYNAAIVDIDCIPDLLRGELQIEGESHPDNLVLLFPAIRAAQVCTGMRCVCGRRWIAETSLNTRLPLQCPGCHALTGMVDDPDPYPSVGGDGSSDTPVLGDR